MTEESAQTRGAIPAWLAIVLIAVALGVGGWYVVKKAFKGRSKDAASGPIPVLEGMKEGWLITRERGAHYLKQGEIELLSARGRVWLFNHVSEPERLALHVLYSTELAKQINLSDEQRTQLKKLKIELPLTAAESRQLSSLFMAHLYSQDEQAAQAAKAFFAEVDRLAQQYVKQPGTTSEERTKRIQEILKPEQVESANNWLAHQAQFGGALPLSPPATAATPSLRDLLMPRRGPEPNAARTTRPSVERRAPATTRRTAPGK